MLRAQARHRGLKRPPRQQPRHDQADRHQRRRRCTQGRKRSPLLVPLPPGFAHTRQRRARDSDHAKASRQPNTQQSPQPVPAKWWAIDAQVAPHTGRSKVSFPCDLLMLESAIALLFLVAGLFIGARRAVMEWVQWEHTEKMLSKRLSALASSLAWPVPSGCGRAPRTRQSADLTWWIST